MMIFFTQKIPESQFGFRIIIKLYGRLIICLLYTSNQIGMAYLDGKTPYILACRGTYKLMTVAAWQLKDNKLERAWRWDGDEENPVVDVYRRQVLIITSTHNSPTSPVVGHNVVNISVVSVSYTHLSLFKSTYTQSPFFKSLTNCSGISVPYTSL